MSDIIVGSGTVSSGLTIGPGDTLDVMSGGLSTDATVISGSTFVVAGVGSASFIGVGAGETIDSGGTAIDDTVAGGAEYVNSGGSLVFAHVAGASSGSSDYFAGIVVQSGAFASGDTIGSQAFLTDAGTDVAAFLHDGGSETVFSDALVSAATIGAGGALFLDLFALARQTTVETSGVLIVSSGARASGVTIESGGTLVVSVGGSATDVTVASGGVEMIGTITIVSSGETLSAAQVGPGDILDVLSGGTAVSATILAGGTGTIESGGNGSAIVDLGALTVLGTDIGVILGNGGYGFSEIVSSGGSESDGTIAGSLVLESGATASGLKVSGGPAIVTVFSGATLVSSTVLAGGSIVVEPGAVTSDLSAGSGGTILPVENYIISAGEVSSGLSVDFLSTLTILSGGTVIATAINGATTVEAGGTLSGGRVASFSPFIVEGIDQGSTIAALGTEDIDAGGIGARELLAGGQISVLSGGLLHDLMVASGSLDIGAGGSASGVTLETPPYPTAESALVTSGGTITGATIDSGATLTVSASGTAIDIVVEGGGVLDALPGAVTSDTTVESGGIVAQHVVISSGQVSNGLTVGPDGTLDVLAGGTAVSAIILSGGTGTIEAGGSGRGIVDEGALVVLGVDTGITLGTGGYGASEVVSSGGIQDGGTIANLLVLDPGAAASGLIVSSYLGQITVSSGATLISASVVSGGDIVISSGGGASAVILQAPLFPGGNGGLVISGGTITGATIDSGAILTVSAGGTAIDTVVESGGVLDAFPGAITSGTTVESGGIVAQHIVVASGQVSSGVTVGPDGTLDVLAGGTAVSATILSGGEIIVLGVDTGVTLGTGGYGASEFVFSGGRESDGTIAGDLLLNPGAVASDLTVSGGPGQITVSSGATLTAAIVLSGGQIIVEPGAVTSNLSTGSGGTILTVENYVISAGEVSSGLSVDDLSTLTILSGGTVIATAIAGATTIEAGGTLSGGQISDFQPVQDDGLDQGSTIIGPSRETIGSGGIAADETLSGGQLSVGSGGLARDLTVSYGSLDIGAGGSASFVTLDAPIFPPEDTNVVESGGTITGATIDSGATLTVSAGGTAIDTVVESGGVLDALTGAITSGTTVDSGGIVAENITVSSGQVSGGVTLGPADFLDILSGGTAISAVLSGGTAIAEAGGTLDAATILSGGSATIDGIESGAVIGSSGKETIDAGGSAEADTVSGGSVQVNSGGTLAAVMFTSASGTPFGVNASVNVNQGGVVSGGTAEAGAFIDLFGTDTATLLRDGAEDDVGSSGLASGVTIGSGGTLIVESGGVASGAILEAGGTLLVSVGGAASGVIGQGGTEIVASATVVSAGQTLSGAQIGPYDVLDVRSGGTAVAATISGEATAEAGGLISGATVTASGRETVSGRDDGAMVSGGALTIENGGVGSGETIAQGNLTILAGGTLISASIAYDPDIDDEGGVIIGGTISESTLSLYGGTDSGTTLVSGTREFVSGNASVGGIAVGNGGALTVGPDKTLSDITVLSGGSLTIASGDVVTGTIAAGGALLEYGSVDTGGLTINPDATIIDAILVTVSSGQVDSGQTFGSASQLTVEAGGTYVSALLSGGDAFVEGGTLAHGTVVGGGDVVLGGGLALDGTVGASGLLQVFGGIDSGAVIRSGGTVEITQGGTDIAATILAGGTLLNGSGQEFGNYFVPFESGGIISRATIAGGTLIDEAGGTATDTTIGQGGLLVVNDASASGGTIASGGSAHIDVLGTISGVTVAAGGTLDVDQGGSYADITVLPGGTFIHPESVFISAGQTSAHLTVGSGPIGEVDIGAGGTLANATLTDVGTITVSSGGLARDTVADNEAIQTGFGLTVSSGGVASGTTLGFDGYLTVLAGGTADGGAVIGGAADLHSGAVASGLRVTQAGDLDIGNANGTYGGGSAFALTVNDGGTIQDFGSASRTAVGSGGLDHVFAGAVDTGATVAGGGELVIESGGTASGATLLSGGIEIIEPGGTASGEHLDGGRIVSAVSSTYTGTATLSNVVVADYETFTIGGPGTLVSATVEAGGLLNPNFGTVEDTVVGSGGTLLGFGDLIGTTILAGGTEEFQYGPLPADPAIDDGTVIIQDGKITRILTGTGSLIADAIFGDPVILAATNHLAGGLIIAAGTAELPTHDAAGTGPILFGPAQLGLVDALQIDGTVAPTNVISGFAIGDAIDLPNIPYVPGEHPSVSGDTVTIPNPVTLTLAGASSLNLVLAPDASGTGTELTVAVPCYRAGTRIATPTGERPIEALRPGDAVLTHDGQSETVRWTGHRRIDCRRHPNPAAVIPVRVRTHAFGPFRPARDLYLSPDHAVFVQGALIPVRLLITGDTIAPAPTDSVLYYHLELDRHAVVLAEGLPAETYLDTGNRDAFANAPIRLAPRFSADPSAYAARSCAPLVVSGPVLERVRAAIGVELPRLSA